MDLESAQRFIADTLDAQKPCICMRCGHEWKPRVTRSTYNTRPKQCPVCRSYNWENKSNTMMTHQEKQHKSTHKVTIAVPTLSIILSQHFLNKGYADSVANAQELATELVDYILSIVEG